MDWWPGTGPLRVRFPRLFSCCETPFITISWARVPEGEPGEWRLRFRRQSGLAEAVEWDNHCSEVHALPIELADDDVSWALEPSTPTWRKGRLPRHSGKYGGP
jgi:hypothetical protein